MLFEVIVKFEHEDGKTSSEKFIIENATSLTEAESIVAKKFKDSIMSYRLTSCKESAYKYVIRRDDLVD